MTDAQKVVEAMKAAHAANPPPKAAMMAVDWAAVLMEIEKLSPIVLQFLLSLVAGGAAPPAP